MRLCATEGMQTASFLQFYLAVVCMRVYKWCLVQDDSCGTCRHSPQESFKHLADTSLDGTARAHRHAHTHTHAGQTEGIQKR